MLKAAGAWLAESPFTGHLLVHNSRCFRVRHRTGHGWPEWGRGCFGIDERMDMPLLEELCEDLPPRYQFCRVSTVCSRLTTIHNGEPQ